MNIYLKRFIIVIVVIFIASSAIRIGYSLDEDQAKSRTITKNVVITIYTNDGVKIKEYDGYYNLHIAFDVVTITDSLGNKIKYFDNDNIIISEVEKP